MYGRTRLRPEELEKVFSANAYELFLEFRPLRIYTNQTMKETPGPKQNAERRTYLVKLVYILEKDL